MPTLSRAEEKPADVKSAASGLVQAMGGLDQARTTIAQLRAGMIADVQRRSPDLAPVLVSFFKKELADGSPRVEAYLKDVQSVAEKYFSDNFSVTEMKEITAFQNSTAGKKFQQKSPGLLQAMAPVITQFQKKLIADALGDSPATKKNEQVK